MRAGVIISVIGHVGAVMMTFLAWETAPLVVPMQGTVVPIEILEISAESNVRALSIPEPEDLAPAAAEEETTPEAVEPPAPSPTPAPRPPRPTPQQNDELDLASIARMVDKQREPGRERTNGATSDRNQRGAGLGTAEVASMQDRIRALTQAHMRRCWRMPSDLPDPERLVVTVEWELDRNGSLRGQPRVTSPRNYNFDPPMRTAAENALRAVRQCDPYPFPNDPIVGEHYDLWRSGDFTFRVSQ
ncbi:MAG: cell envelope integrity protein TolA [Terricaulis sp.]